tara:strand:+ start:253 stop:765 length:513 start_codon:yes stop_codon:yes gene_type:complete
MSSDSILRPIKIPGKRFILTKNMILESQKHTKSNMSAANWLRVSYNTYKKWAKYYNIFEQHLNQEGVGIKKGWAHYRIPLDDILSGAIDFPQKYSLAKIKKRLIEEGYFEEECKNCGYNEINIATNKVCLNIDFEDGDSNNFDLSNIRLLCPNCYLSYNGLFYKSKIFCK